MTLKIGMIGCGHIAKFHARNIRDAISRHGIDADYHAVCDLDVGRAERFAQIGGCALVTTDAREVVDACEVVQSAWNYLREIAGALSAHPQKVWEDAETSLSAKYEVGGLQVAVQNSPAVRVH